MINEFLKPLSGYACYEVAKLAITTDLNVPKLAEKLGLTKVTVQKRINMACEHLGLPEINRQHLCVAYIEFLEERIKSG